MPTGWHSRSSPGLNRFARSFPAKIETTLSCTRSAASLPVGRPRLAPPPPAFDYRRVPAPPQQRTMPNAPSAPVRPAVGLGQPLDVSKIPVPK